MEGALLARYRYDVLKGKPTVEPITELLPWWSTGDARLRSDEAPPEGSSLPRRPISPVTWPTPHPPFSTALDMAEVATRLGKKRGLEGRDLR